MGVSPRSGDELFFGDVAAEMLERSPCAIVFLSSEPPLSAPDNEAEGG